MLEKDALSYLIELLDPQYPDALVVDVVSVFCNLTLAEGDVCSRLVFDADIVGRAIKLIKTNRPSLMEVSLHLLRNLIADEDIEIYEYIAK